MGGTGCRSAAKGVQSIKDASFFRPQVNMTYDLWHHFSSFRLHLYSSIWDSGNKKIQKRRWIISTNHPLSGGMLVWRRVPFREVTHIPLVGGFNPSEKNCQIGSFPHIGMKIPPLIAGNMAKFWSWPSHKPPPDVSGVVADPWPSNFGSKSLGLEWI